MTRAQDLLAEACGDRERFLDALIAEMTLAEKLGQLSLYAIGQDPHSDPYNPVFNSVAPDARLAAVRRGEVGGFFSATGVAELTALQRIALGETRLGIPLVFAADVIHGFRTIFPIPLAEAASWDPELAERTARFAANEASAAGLDWTFAPGMDIARDARWGRMAESSGEDPLLAARLAAARVRGYQTDDLTRPDAILATAKHFAGYGAAEAGLDYNTADISWRTLIEFHLPAFHAAVTAGVGAVMTAFNDVDGIPCTAHPQLLGGILRDAWGFDGLIVSDYASDAEMVAHGYAESERDAARLALLAGLDVTLESGLFIEHGASLIASGEVPPEIVDAAVRRMLTAKLKLGLFADPFRRLDTAREQQARDHTAARACARDAAVRSAVLLKNDGDLLPLPSSATIALIGPFAEDHANLNGCWSIFGRSEESVSLRDGLAAAFGADKLLVAPGCELDNPIEGGLAAVAEAVAAADFVVLAIGESERWTGEARSRVDGTLPAVQLALARAVAAMGKPIVTLVRTGRPVPLTEIAAVSGALMLTWFMGSETGHAVADLLTGARAPAGRLPVSMPRRAGQTPLYYNHKRTGRPPTATGVPFSAQYLDAEPGPLYPFGHGLTYTQFEYGPTCVHAGSSVATATITNTGARDGEAVVQLYLRDVAASIVRPVRELKDFQRIALAPGETRLVRFELRREDLAFLRRDGSWGWEPGAFEVWIADHAESGTAATLMLDDGMFGDA